MPDTMKLLLTGSVTLLLGITLIIFGQLIIRYVFDPISRLNRTKSEIVEAIALYGNIIFNPGLSREIVINDAYRLLRKLSIQVKVDYYTINRMARRLICEKEVQLLSKNLLIISNCLWKEESSLINKKLSEEILLILEDRYWLHYLVEKSVNLKHSIFELSKDNYNPDRWGLLGCWWSL